MSDGWNDIETRLEAATPGPWQLMETGGLYQQWILGAAAIADEGWYGTVDVFTLDDDNYSGGLIQEDAELIAHAPEDLTRLLTRVRELEAPERVIEAATMLAQTTPHSLASATEALLTATNLYTRVRELEGQRDAVLTIHRRGLIYTSGSTDPKHKSSSEFRCTDDHLLWPCPTVKALGADHE